MTTPEEPGIAIGVDLGEARIGVAASDRRRRVATPRAVVARTGDEHLDHLALAALVAELGATVVVVGLPLSLDGRRGPAARRVVEEAGRLEAALGVPVELSDERFSTVEATRRRTEAARAAGRHRRRRRGAIDAEAAALILQTFLERAAR